MLIAELRDIEHILRFIEIVPVVAIRKHLGIDVANPGFVDISNNLIANCNLSEPAGLREVFAGLFVALVAIEQTQRNAEVEGDRVVRAVAVIVGL
jgi:hypothetical protein